MNLPSIDILLTNFCNQNCSFCFARKEMESPLKKEISFSDFKLLVKLLKKNSILTVNFLGGEPTIHSRFIQIIEYSLKHFFFIHIYTNGIFPPNVKKTLLKAASHISLIINISTPAFQINKRTRALVINHIKEFSSITNVTLAITHTFQDDIEILKLLDFIDEDILKKIGIRLGFTSPIAGERNFISIDDFPKVGPNICKIIKYLEKKSPPKYIGFNSSLTPCMFSATERRFLKERKIQIRSDCHLGFNDRWFAITPYLSTFECYPLSTRERFKINKNTDLTKIRDKFHLLQLKYRKQLVLSKCRSCLFYGIGEGKCSGPCLAFRINALQKPLRQPLFLSNNPS